MSLTDYRADGPCPDCEDGTLRKTPRGRTHCDTCAISFCAADTRTTTIQLPRHRSPHRNREYDTYTHSARIRLVGGHRDAYIAGSDGDNEYAIDQYDEITSGLWTPRKREWERTPA